MAFTMKSGKMASNVLDSMLANAKAAEAIKDGSLVKLGDLIEDDVYGDADYDTYAAAKPADGEEVVIADYAGISEGAIAGNEYKLGVKLHDLMIPAGAIFRVRRLALHDKFWLGQDNFDTVPTVGKFAVAEAGKYEHKVAAEKPATGYAVKIIAEKGMTVGMKADGKLFLCEVVHL